MHNDTELKKFRELKEKINQFTHREKSLLERYEINYSGMLIYSATDVDIDFCQNHIRESDVAIALTPNLTFIVYSVVGGQDAMKAADHILHSYHEKYPYQKTYSVLSSQDQKISAAQLGDRLIQLLQFAIDQKVTNHIVTLSDLNNLY